MVQTAANRAAWNGETRLVTRGRVRVRGVCASSGASRIWLKVFAAAEVRNVPIVRLAKRDIDVGRGERARPVVAVRVIRMDRFRFDKAEYAPIRRPSVRGGRVL